MAAITGHRISRAYTAARPWLTGYQGISASRDRQISTGMTAQQGFRSTSGSAFTKGLCWTAGMTAAVATAGVSAGHIVYNYMPPEAAKFILNNMHYITGSLAATATLGVLSLGISMARSSALRSQVYYLGIKSHTDDALLGSKNQQIANLEKRIGQQALDDEKAPFDFVPQDPGGDLAEPGAEDGLTPLG